MRKITRFGAAALALALTVTFVTPTTALAAKKSKVETQTTLTKLSDEEDYGIIDTDEKKLGTFTGTGDTADEASDDCRSKVYDALIAGGYAITTDPDVYADEFYKGGQKYYTYISTSNGKITLGDDGKYTATIDVSVTVYKNRMTGATSVFENMVHSNYAPNDANRKFVSAIRIKSGEITYLAVPMSGGDTTISKIKSSSKKILAASAYNKIYYENNTNADDYNWYYSEDATGKGTYTLYYYTTVGAKVVVGTYEKYDDLQNAKKSSTHDGSSATRYIKLDPKKIGKSTLSFNIVNKDGKVTPVKTTVHVVDDITPFKTITFAGKSLLGDYSNSKNINYGKVSGKDSTWNVSAKNKGKLVVKANKNIKIKKIEVGKLYKETKTRGLTGKDDYGNDYDHSASYAAYNKSWETTTHREDLNGDGDFDDVVNGISEWNITYKYSTVKSGKSISLGTVGVSDTDEDDPSTFTYTSKDGVNSKDAALSGSLTNKTRSYLAPTRIRITYFDGFTKSYSIYSTTIYRKVSN